MNEKDEIYVEKYILGIAEYLSIIKIIIMLDLNVTSSVQWSPGTSEVITGFPLHLQPLLREATVTRCDGNLYFVSLWITGVTPLNFINFAMMKN